jgi:hypothetical protein
MNTPPIYSLETYIDNNQQHETFITHHVEYNEVVYGCFLFENCVRQ